MTASVLKQAPNTKRFKRTLIYLNTDTQYAHFRLSVVLWLDKGDFPENVHTVCPFYTSTVCPILFQITTVSLI